MNPHFSSVLDSCIIVATAAITAASTLVLTTTEAAHPAQLAELYLLLLPFLGALVLSGGMIMLNPNPEARRIVIGRSIIALFFGVTLPQIVGMFHPSLAALSLKPIVLILIGGLSAALAYVMSKPFTSEMYQRADAIARREAAKLEKKFSGKDEDEEETRKLP